MASATVGPIRYQFDPAQLLMAEVLVQVPPTHGDLLWGAKLIPTQRADMLGQEICEYGQSGRAETCEAHREPGLVLALLTRPLDYYRDAFVAEGLEEELSPTELGGSHGFAFTAEAEGGNTDYRFLPLRDRTVLLGQQFSSEQDLGEEAIEDVLRSVAAGLDAVHP